MPRINSLQHAPVDARIFLRNRFSRFLSTATQDRHIAEDQTVLADDIFVELLKSVVVERGNESTSAQALYQSIATRDDGSFDDLIAAGYVTSSWGRIHFWRSVSPANTEQSATQSSAFKAIYNAAHSHRYVAAPSGVESSVSEIAERLIGQKLRIESFVCRAPSWVAARMWEFERQSAPSSEILRRWVDHWKAVGRPHFPVSDWLSDVDAKFFAESALEVIQHELKSWDTTWKTWGLKYRLSNDASEIDLPGYYPRIPITLAERAVWLHENSLEGFLYETAADYGDTLCLVHILCDEIAQKEYASAPHPLAKSLFQLAVDRPLLLRSLFHYASENPRILVDMLLYAPLAAAACIAVARWTGPSSAWQRELREAGDATTRQFAFDDAVSVAADFVAQGTLPANEMAALWTWLHRQSSDRYFNREGSANNMLDSLRREMMRQSDSIFLKMAQYLIEPRTSVLGSFEFAACLDILHAGRLDDKIEPTDFLIRYIDSFKAEPYKVIPSSINNNAAKALVSLAMRQDTLLRQRFWSPVEIKERLNEITPDDNEITIKRDLARYLRSHIRVLARAISGWSGEVPDELIHALALAIENGASDAPQKGWISAFQPSFEHNSSSSEHPIAADIGGAIARLGVSKAEPLIASIVESDEPLILAELLRFTRVQFHDRLKQRLVRLTPNRAAQVWSLPETQARISAMLSAGLADCAEPFIREEEQAKTLGRVQGRAVMRLQYWLRLRLLKCEWDEIKRALPPAELNQSELESAHSMIQFFQAIVELKRPDGNTELAERMFWNLRSRRSDIISYSVNWFAARASTLLGREIFGSIGRERLAECYEAIARGEDFVIRSSNSTEEDKITFRCNQALLLLALGETQSVIDLLTPLQSNHLHESVAAYMAVALFRSGREREAMAVLAHAEYYGGYATIIDAAREHIVSGAKVFGSSNLLEDKQRTIKAVLFEFSRLDHSSQAAILQPTGNLIVEFVKQATAALMSLAPMMKVVQFTNSEDDLNALLRELLLARLEFLHWSASDQGKGGFTALGNPGERDVVLRKYSQILAVIEAVVCRHSIGQQNLTFHFHKLLAYESCSLFFHLTYSFIGRSSEIVVHLKQEAKQYSHPAHQYVGMEDVRFDSSGPIGFVAQYQTDRGQINVVFLVLDLGQPTQREAALHAIAYKKRTRDTMNGVPRPRKLKKPRQRHNH